MCEFNSTEPPEWFEDFKTGEFMMVAKEITSVKEVALSNNRALRGYDGQKGLLTEFSILQKKVDDTFDFGKKIFVFFVTSAIGIIFLIVTTVITTIILSTLQF